MSAAGNGHFDLKHRSRALTEGRDRAAARAYLKGIGYDDGELERLYAEGVLYDQYGHSAGEARVPHPAATVESE